ncbi:hypothetical protein DRO69_06020 [Candidatus Bathyarchaeota archaeon]|nr:MAG: hypothetical protein DRO69_06020 [Candidatus Bathyarchaeota archaeon]
MELLPEKRFGIFLIAVSVWYLINLKIFNALQPILALPASVTVFIGLWFLLAPFTSTVPSTIVTRPNASPQVSAPAAMKLETMPMSKSATTKAELKISKKTKKPSLTVKKPVRKSVRKKKTSKSSA